MTLPVVAKPTAPAQVLPKPPVELAWLTDYVGAEGVLLLIEEYGGLRLYIPKNVDQAKFKNLLGHDSAEKLCRAYGGENYKIPLAKNWRIRLYRTQGWSYAEIAKKTGSDENTVHKNLQNARMTNKAQQLSFFNEAF